MAIDEVIRAYQESARLYALQLAYLGRYPEPPGQLAAGQPRPTDAMFRMRQYAEEERNRAIRLQEGSN